MDKRVYLLTVISFIVGMVELIIGGILDLVATDLQVTVGQAGLLITVFSLVFAIAAPILLFITSDIERKQLTIWTLVVFLIGNVIAVFSPTYSFLLIARIISAASGSLLTVLCITMASNLVSKRYVGRAIGTVVMGISGSLVLGVPIGLILGHQFGWRMPFVFISVLTICLIVGVHFLMGKVAPQPTVPLKQQLMTLKNSKIFFAQMTTFLFLAGHFTFYAYFTPFLKSTMNMNGTWVSIIYFVFGIAAVLGGGVGGTLADRFGAKRIVISVTALFALSMFIIPYMTFAVVPFLLFVIIWGMASWAITPPLQSYLIESAPKTAAIQQSLNNSALHFGVAFGSFIGSIVIERTTVEMNATVGSLFVLFALGSAIFSMTRSNEQTAVENNGRTRV